MATLGSIPVTYSTQLRDESGRFIAACDEAARASAEELAENVASLAKVFAPHKTGALAGSINWFMETAFKGVAFAGAPYAAPQEHGAGAHEISTPEGPLANKEEGFFARSGRVTHPGNPAVHYMQRAGAAVAATSAAVIRAHFPAV